VVGDRVASEHGLQAASPRSQAEIQVFEAEEVILVQESCLLEHPPLNQHQAAAHGIDDLRAGCGNSVAPPAESSMPHASREGCVRQA
jgi:hypothetical protein